MRSDWLWDRKISDAKAKKVLKNPDSEGFFAIAALLLSRKNEPREVFKNYLNPVVFCRHWSAIKRRMRQDKWSEPRIVFWQAIYEKLSARYRKKGMVFRQEAPAKKEFCEMVGKKVAVIRREDGLSQKKLAKRIGISQQIISRIESGAGNISLTTLTRVADALKRKVEINFLT